MFKMVLEVQQGSRQPRSAGPRPMSAAGSACNFCSGTGHFIQQCEVVAEYNRASKCKCAAADSKVVLPSGAMVPRDIPGTWLQDRLDEWHWLNPGQMASQMILEVAMAQSVTVLVSESVSRSSMGCPAQYLGQCPEVSQTGSYALRQVPGPHLDAATVPRPVRDIPAARGSGNIGSKGGNPSPFGQDALPHFTRGPTSPDKTGARIKEVKEPNHQYAPRPPAEVSQPAAPAQRKHEQAYCTSLPPKSTTTKSRSTSTTAPWKSQSP